MGRETFEDDSERQRYALGLGSFAITHKQRVHGGNPLLRSPAKSSTNLDVSSSANGVSDSGATIAAHNARPVQRVKNMRGTFHFLIDRPLLTQKGMNVE